LEKLLSAIIPSGPESKAKAGQIAGALIGGVVSPLVPVIVDLVFPTIAAPLPDAIEHHVVAIASWSLTTALGAILGRKFVYAGPANTK
jgi:hypothetical protein